MDTELGVAQDIAGRLSLRAVKTNDETLNRPQLLMKRAPTTVSPPSVSNARRSAPVKRPWAQRQDRQEHVHASAINRVVCPAPEALLVSSSPREIRAQAWSHLRQVIDGERGAASP